MALKRIYLILGLILGAVTASAQEYVTITYIPSDDIINNPERGMMTHHEFWSNQANEFELDQLDALRAQGMSLVFTCYVMPDFRDKPISKPYLNRIKRNLKAMRRTGMKAVLRFCYTYSENDHPWDAPWEITQQHIEQLKPIFEEFSDVIAVLEAGFVGVWGEWYYTDNYVFQPRNDQYEARAKLLQALLDAMPQDRCVSVRYPVAKMAIQGIEYTDTIGYNDAYNGSNRSRIGFHNDCFLATSDDMGTFNDVPENRQYWLWESRFLPMGGETCQLSEFCEVENAAKDFAAYHWSYLNQDYNHDVLDPWERVGFMDEIKRRLGYRFELREGSFTAEPQVGQPLHIELTIDNTGWATPYNPRPVILTLVGKKGSKESYSLTLNDDPRLWQSGKTHTIVTNWQLPQEMTPGEYELRLSMPDPSPTLADKPEFAIRLANKDIWNKKGYHKLHTLTIK